MSSPAELVVGALARPLSWLYGLGARLHRVGARIVRPLRDRPACAIVSVGAITVGGAGKTPLAARLAAGLARRGHRVVLASRGYKGSAREPVTVVSDGAHIHAYAAEAGDESLVLAAHAPGVAVLVGRDRRVVGNAAVAQHGAEILVLDDGFQHHRLPRDLDIVSVDARSGFGNGRVLPAGPLREPASALARADWLCLVDRDGALPPNLERRLAAHVRRGRFVFEARRKPTGLRSLDARERLPLASLAGRRVGLLCAIARPNAFRRTVEGLGAEVAAIAAFPDHHAYRARDLAELDADVTLWLTTEKDAIKILPSWCAGRTIQVLEIEVEIAGEEDVIERIETALYEAGRLAKPSA